jgi:hypothetical protein
MLLTRATRFVSLHSTPAELQLIYLQGACYCLPQESNQRNIRRWLRRRLVQDLRVWTGERCIQSSSMGR